MAKGRKTGGRVKGSQNKATLAKQAAIAATGLTPLDYLLSVLRNEDNSQDDRMEAAKSAAPYVHPRLGSVEVEAGPQLAKMLFAWAE
jgi:uncharacterized caspase-like protein